MRKKGRNYIFHICIYVYVYIYIYIYIYMFIQFKVTKMKHA